MANIAAKDVMELRKKTGIGMMECKKALVESEGDFDQAMKILRVVLKDYLAYFIFWFYIN